MSQNLSTGLTIILIIVVTILGTKVYENNVHSTPVVINNPVPSSNRNDENNQRILDEINKNIELHNNQLIKEIKLLDLKIAEAAKASTKSSHSADNSNDARNKELEKLKDLVVQLQKQINRKPTPANESSQIAENKAAQEVKENKPVTEAQTPATIKPKPTEAELARRERRARDSFQIIRDKANKYMKQKQYAKAYFQLGQFPAKLLDTAAGKAWHDFKEDIHKTIRMDYKEQEKIVEEYLDKGQYPLAIGHLESLRSMFECDVLLVKELNERIKTLNSEYDEILSRPIKKPVVEEKKNPVKEVKKDFKAIIAQLASEDYNQVKKARNALTKAGKEALEDMITETENKNATIRRYCIILISQINVDGNKKAEQAFISALRDREPDVCHAALKALTKITSYKALDEIITLVHKDNLENKLAKQAVTSFNEIVGMKIPGSTYLNKDNAAEIQKTMKDYWKKNKSKFIKTGN